MRFIRRPFGRLVVSGAVVLGAIGLLSSACTATERTEPAIAESGAVCIEREGPANSGELCFRNDDGTTYLVGSEILVGSTMTIRGGRGDDMYVTVDSELGFRIEVSGQIVERPFRAFGTWSDGTPVELVVDW